MRGGAILLRFSFVNKHVWQGPILKHALKPSQYAILVAIMLTASVGDSLLSRGMGQIGQVDLHHLGLLWRALFNPFVDAGILLLLRFFLWYNTAFKWGGLSVVDA